MSAPATGPAPSPALHGFCTPPSMAELIRDLYLDERSGALVVSRGGAEKRIYLDRGMILTVTSTLPDEKLLAFLVARQLVRADEAEALKGLDDRQAIGVLTSRGVLSGDALQQVNRDLAQQILAAIFRWDDLEYRFDEGPIAAGPLQTNVVISFELIIRALRSMTGFEQVKEAMLRQDRALRFSDQIYLPFEQLKLTPVEGFLVSRLDGQTKIRDVLAQTPPDEEESAARFLFGLLILGLVQFVPAIGSGPLSCRDLVKGDEEKQQRESREKEEILDFYKLAHENRPDALLGVNESATSEQVKAAYLERKERYQASRFLKKVQTDCREELQIIEARLLEGFLALRSRKLGAARAAGNNSERVVSLDLEQLSMRKELSKTERQSNEEERSRMADQFFSKARDYWKMGDYFNCIRYCEFAGGYNDKLAAVWSLLGQALSRNPDYRWQKRAETALQKAAELEAFNPGHFILLGDFYRTHGLNAKSKKEYEKALALVPNHAQALQALKELSKIKD